MPSRETRVAPGYRNGKSTGWRTGAEAFESEGMDPCHIDIDGLRLRALDTQGPERAPIANQEYARFEIGRQLSPESNSGLEPASTMVQLVRRKSSRVTNVAIERDALRVN